MTYIDLGIHLTVLGPFLCILLKIASSHLLPSSLKFLYPSQLSQPLATRTSLWSISARSILFSTLSRVHSPSFRILLSPLSNLSSYFQFPRLSYGPLAGSTQLTFLVQYVPTNTSRAQGLLCWGSSETHPSHELVHSPSYSFWVRSEPPWDSRIIIVLKNVWSCPTRQNSRYL